MDNPNSGTRAKDRTALREAVVATAVVSAVAVVLVHLMARPPLDAYAGVAVAIVFLLPAVRLAGRHDASLRHFGLALGGLFGDGPPSVAATGAASPRWGAVVRDAAREIGFAALVCAIVFPPFAVGFWAWFRFVGPAPGAFHLALPPDAATFALNQLVVAALPEEAFFRGYLQTRLSDALGTRRRILGAELCVPAWIAQAGVFGLVHVIADLNALRLSVCFPGLLFGWVRARRGGIGAAMVVHAASNLFSATLAESWFR
ncbi:MAG: MrtC family glutamic-type intramembrane protease [Polyangiales bacterium]